MPTTEQPGTLLFETCFRNYDEVHEWDYTGDGHIEYSAINGLVLRNEGAAIRSIDVDLTDFASIEVYVAMGASQLETYDECKVFVSFGDDDDWDVEDLNPLLTVAYGNSRQLQEHGGDGDDDDDGDSSNSSLENYYQYSYYIRTLTPNFAAGTSTECGISSDGIESVSKSFVAAEQAEWGHKVSFRLVADVDGRRDKCLLRHLRVEGKVGASRLDAGIAVLGEEGPNVRSADLWWAYLLGVVAFCAVAGVVVFFVVKNSRATNIVTPLKAVADDVELGKQSANAAAVANTNTSTSSAAAVNAPLKLSAPEVNTASRMRLNSGSLGAVSHRVSPLKLEPRPVSSDADTPPLSPTSRRHTKVAPLQALTQKVAGGRVLFHDNTPYRI